VHERLTAAATASAAVSHVRKVCDSNRPVVEHNITTTFDAVVLALSARVGGEDNRRPIDRARHFHLCALHSEFFDTFICCTILKNVTLAE
jgi:hypothetical protein